MDRKGIYCGLYIAILLHFIRKIANTLGLLNTGKMYWVEDLSARNTYIMLCPPLDGLTPGTGKRGEKYVSRNEKVFRCLLSEDLASSGRTIMTMEEAAYAWPDIYKNAFDICFKEFRTRVAMDAAKIRLIQSKRR